MTPWIFRVVWPVESDEATYNQLVEVASEEIVEIAEERGVRLMGEPAWEMVEHDDVTRWPYTELALVAWAPAMPSNPSRDEWPTIVRYLAGEGMSDRDIGKQFGVPRDTINYVRRKHGIPAGRPPGTAVGRAA